MNNADEFKIIGEGDKRKLAVKRWRPEYRELMLEQNIRRIVLSGYFGWTSPDVSFLETIPFVERLVLMAPRIRDVSPLYTLPALSDLSVDGNIGCIDFTKIPSLRSVSLNWAPKRFGSLLECKQLEELGISYLRVPDLTLFAKLRSLRLLCIGYSDTVSLNGIQEFASLSFLGLARVNKLKSLEFVQSCRDLARLQIEGAKSLRDVTMLQSLTELKAVTFKDCPSLESVAALRSCSKLQSIGLLGTTNVHNGDLRFVLELPALEHASIRDRTHYTVRNNQLPKGCRTLADEFPKPGTP